MSTVVQVLSVLGGATPTEVRPSHILRALAFLRAGVNDQSKEIISENGIDILLRILHLYKTSVNEQQESAVATDRVSYIQVALGCLDVLAHLVQSSDVGGKQFLDLDGPLVICLAFEAHQQDLEVIAAGLTCIAMVLAQSSNAQRVAINDHIGGAILPFLIEAANQVNGETRSTALGVFFQSSLTFLIGLMQHYLDLRGEAARKKESSPSAEMSSCQSVIQEVCSGKVIEALLHLFDCSDDVARSRIGWKFAAFFDRRCEILFSKSLPASSSSTSSQSSVSAKEDALHSFLLLTRVVQSLLLLLSLASQASKPVSTDAISQIFSTLQALCIGYEETAGMLTVATKDEAGSSSSSSLAVIQLDGLSTLLAVLRGEVFTEHVGIHLLRLLNTLLVQKSSSLPSGASSILTKPNDMTVALEALTIAVNTNSSDTTGSLHARVIELGFVPLLVRALDSSETTLSEFALEYHTLALYAFTALFQSGKWIAPSATPVDVTKSLDASDSPTSTSSPSSNPMLQSVIQLFHALLRLQSSSIVSLSTSLLSPHRLPQAHAIASTLYVLGGSPLAAREIVRDGGIKKIWDAIDQCKEQPTRVAPLFVCLLRIGSALPLSFLVDAFAAEFPRATKIGEELLASVPENDAFSEQLMDVLLLMQGKAAPPVKYRS